MAKIALYQKYRSSSFEEVIGQEYIVRSIKNAVRTNKTGHAYLFCGPRGTGKTTMARLLAKAVNCEHPEIAPCNQCDNCRAANAGTHPDIVEINAANETHVDDIRDLIERSTLAPMMGKHKVYIIDEVHQLSSAASSALLKTLEEPPENVIFILATTDPQKLLPTIISRCQRYDFTKVRTDLIENHLLDIAQKENIQMDQSAAHMIAVLADGGMRDALSIMDQCASYTNDHIMGEDVNRIYGLTSVDEKIELLESLIHKDIGSLIKKCENYELNGIDLQRFVDGLTDILKDVVVYDSTKDDSLLKVLNNEQAEKIGKEVSSSEAMHIARTFLESKQKFRLSGSMASAFEITCLSLASETETVQPVQVQRTISEITPSPSVNKTENKPEVKIEVKPAKVLSEDEVLSILVQCTKADKSEDESKLQTIVNTTDLDNRKYAVLLGSTTIGASGKDCILLKSSQTAVVNRINEDSTNKELYFFLKGKGIDKMIFAITNDMYQKCTAAFVTRRKENTLPGAMQIERYADHKKEETPLDKAKSLFGDSLEVVEGDQNGN